MWIQNSLGLMVSDVKKILPNDISKAMAFLLEEFPEDFIAGCQFKPGCLKKHFSPKQRDVDLDNAELINVLLSWYFTQSVALFDKDFSDELIRTEGTELNATTFLRLTGNPVYIPLENKINNVVGCLLAISGARYENQNENGWVVRFDISSYIIGADERFFSKSGFGYTVDDVGKINSNDFINALKDVANLDEQAANEITNKLFYLLSDEPESILWRKNNLDFKPNIVKHKRRANTIYAPQYPRITLLGKAFGDEIRKVSIETGTGRSVRPHIRRAHWHSFLCGVGRAQKKIRWINPIFVHSRSKETNDDAR